MEETTFSQIEDITFNNMYNAWMTGIVGMKEFRNWLAEKDPAFNAARDSSVDDQIDEMARERAAHERDQQRRREEREREQQQLDQRTNT